MVGKGNNIEDSEIDMTKAYDKVKWDIISKQLNLHGFWPYFYNLIGECMSMLTYLVLINGSPIGLFLVNKGIRQGEPFSPRLFTILFGMLSRVIFQANLEGNIHWIKV